VVKYAVSYLNVDIFNELYADAVRALEQALRDSRKDDSPYRVVSVSDYGTIIATHCICWHGMMFPRLEYHGTIEALNDVMRENGA
jgi:hypothetical protein